jgi:hypothetical protein
VDERCRGCESWPVFSDKPTTYLWLTDYGELPDCIHYIAISYCWQQPGDNMPVEKPYDIMTKRGRRKGRAPRNVVNRAIKYASRYGIRLIWIDQECIEQDNREDKENGIQSMDLVYSRSMYPVGLLNSFLKEQSQIDALAHIVARGEAYFNEEVHPSYEEASASEVIQKLEALEILAEDKWFTRTWIFQEATLAGERMVFLISCTHGIEHPSLGTLSGEIMLTADNIENFSTGGVHFVLDCLSRLMTQPDSTTKRRFLRVEKFLTDRLSMGFESLSHLSNAVAVVNLVSAYSNKRVSDRLAIVANLCEYQVRLKTAELEEKNYSFSTCLLVMALLNGDISILQFWHELSHSPSRQIASAAGKREMINECSMWQSFSWAPSQIASIQPCHPLMGESPMRLVGSSLDHRGLAMQGWMWGIDQRVDLADLHNRFQESWEAAIAESQTTFPTKWDDIGEFMRLFIQTLGDKGLADVQNLVLLKVVKSTVWHRSLGNKREDENGSISEDLKFVKAMEIGDDMLGHSSTSSYITVEPEPVDTEDLGSDDKFYGQILDDFYQPSFPMSRYPWLWLIPSIMKDAALYFGRPIDATNSLNTGCGIFEYGGAGYFLTPRVRGQRQDELPLDFKDRPNSWLVQPTNELADGVHIVQGKGMVRGLWKIGQAEPRSFIIS